MFFFLKKNRHFNLRQLLHLWIYTYIYIFVCTTPHSYKYNLLQTLRCNRHELHLTYTHTHTYITDSIDLAKAKPSWGGVFFLGEWGIPRIEKYIKLVIPSQCELPLFPFCSHPSFYLYQLALSSSLPLPCDKTVRDFHIKKYNTH